MRYKLLASLLFGAYAIGTLAASAQTIHDDPRLAALRVYMAAKYPAPDGCEAVGVWEDGSQVAYCIAEDAWIARGPDADDSWQPFPEDRVFPLWRERVNT
jgi:hypothetical protein